MASFTLDELREVVNEKYAPLEIPMGEAGTARLIQALRLPDDKLGKLTAIQREFNAMQQEEKDEDGKVIEPDQDDQLKMRPLMIEKLRAMIRTVTETEEQAESLISAVGDDLPFLMTIIEKYSETTQLGEASASPTS